MTEQPTCYLDNNATTRIAPEVIDDGFTGMLAESAEADAIASALRRIVAARASWPAVGNAARARSRQFGAARMVRAYEALYEELAER